MPTLERLDRNKRFPELARRVLDSLPTEVKYTSRSRGSICTLYGLVRFVIYEDGLEVQLVDFPSDHPSGKKWFHFDKWKYVIRPKFREKDDQWETLALRNLRCQLDLLFSPHADESFPPLLSTPPISETSVLHLSHCHMPDDPAVGSLHFQEYDGGKYVFLGPDDSLRANLDIPGWMQHIWDTAVQRNCLAICFDKHGKEDPRFDIYK